MKGKLVLGLRPAILSAATSFSLRSGKLASSESTQGQNGKIPSDDNTRSDRIPTVSTLVGSEQGLPIHDYDPRKPISIAEEAGEVIVLPTLGRNPDSTSRHSLDPIGPPSPLRLEHEMPALNNEGPRPVADPVEESPRSDHEDDGNKDDQEAEAPMEHTLRDFFQANQVTDNDLSQTSGSDIRAEESAATYFNRQASLLMLYFPLAYMFIFAFSMVRLLYDMITSKPNAGLTIASLWFILSAGVIDALVYGFAEIVVRRRVRRNLPRHLSQLRGSQSGDV
ncbi:hypothetical protein QFC20_006915 [Naganishia adeliensis]|uniref:Uncharacterized protein n=1 Tax=Naganishia adeliensis TaxID=92952 RepID=A0ACC2V5R3_9TREE|nr:hypothetical protein QFC20_006915 [Naganishia adeliensis]